MKTKEEKALENAQKVWGDYINDNVGDTYAYSDLTLGEISQSDYLAGYNQAVEDSLSKEMLDMLNFIVDEMKNEGYPELMDKIKQLIEKSNK